MLLYRSGFISVQILLLLHYARSFVLLTANVDDIKKLARKFVSESMASQIAGMISKAHGQTLNLPGLPTDDEIKADISVSAENELNADVDISKEEAVLHKMQRQSLQKASKRYKKQTRATTTEAVKIESTMPEIEEIDDGDVQIEFKKREPVEIVNLYQTNVTPEKNVERNDVGIKAAKVQTVLQDPNKKWKDPELWKDPDLLEGGDRHPKAEATRFKKLKALTVAKKLLKHKLRPITMTSETEIDVTPKIEPVQIENPEAREEKLKTNKEVEKETYQKPKEVQHRPKPQTPLKRKEKHLQSHFVTTKMALKQMPDYQDYQVGDVQNNDKNDQIEDNNRSHEGYQLSKEYQEKKEKIQNTIQINKKGKKRISYYIQDYEEQENRGNYGNKQGNRGLKYKRNKQGILLNQGNRNKGKANHQRLKENEQKKEGFKDKQWKQGHQAMKGNQEKNLIQSVEDNQSKINNENVRGNKAYQHSKGNQRNKNTKGKRQKPKYNNNMRHEESRYNKNKIMAMNKQGKEENRIYQQHRGYQGKAINKDEIDSIDENRVDQPQVGHQGKWTNQENQGRDSESHFDTENNIDYTNNNKQYGRNKNKGIKNLLIQRDQVDYEAQGKRGQKTRFKNVNDNQVESNRIRKENRIVQKHIGYQGKGNNKEKQRYDLESKGNTENNIDDADYKEQSSREKNKGAKDPHIIRNRVDYEPQGKRGQKSRYTDVNDNQVEPVNPKSKENYFQKDNPKENRLDEINRNHTYTDRDYEKQTRQKGFGENQSHESWNRENRDSLWDQTKQPNSNSLYNRTPRPKDFREEKERKVEEELSQGKPNSWNQPKKPTDDSFGSRLPPTKGFKAQQSTVRERTGSSEWMPAARSIVPYNKPKKQGRFALLHATTPIGSTILNDVQEPEQEQDHGQEEPEDQNQAKENPDANPDTTPAPNDNENPKDENLHEETQDNNQENNGGSADENKEDEIQNSLAQETNQDQTKPIDVPNNVEENNGNTEDQTDQGKDELGQENRTSPGPKDDVSEDNQESIYIETTPETVKTPMVLGLKESRAGKLTTRKEEENEFDQYDNPKMHVSTISSTTSPVAAISATPRAKLRPGRLLPNQDIQPVSYEKVPGQADKNDVLLPNAMDPLNIEYDNKTTTSGNNIGGSNVKASAEVTSKKTLMVIRL